MDKLTNDEQFTCAMQLANSTSLTMVLVTSIKLKVLEAIAEAGPDAQLSAREITSRLSIVNNPHAPDMLDRMLYLLASHSVVTCSQRVNEMKPVRVYGLAPVARFFVPNEDGVSLGPLMEWVQDEVFIKSWFELEKCVLEGGIPFDKVHGVNAFEYSALNGGFNKGFNIAMANHSTIMIKELLQHYHGFDKLKNVVDVGGGSGATLNMIVKQHPLIKGINYDLPHVIQHAPIYPGIEHLGGDMFQSVPEGDAIFMKWILHDFSDDWCVMLLKNCYKALPHGGKVIVVEAILPFLPEISYGVQASANIDAVLMTQFPGGKERTENEFQALAKCAGFDKIRKECLVYNFWVMEFYK